MTSLQNSQVNNLTVLHGGAAAASVAYGNASGKPDAFDVLTLSRLGSLYMTRPRLSDYVANRAELELCAGRFFAALAAGTLLPHAVERFALSDAAAAHVHLEDRGTLTIPILVP